MPGIVSSSVGYTGGTSINPTYDSVCRGDGHTEALRLQFDPSVVTYEQLMTHVLKEASPHPTKAQYKTAIWAQTPAQKATADRLAQALGKPVPILEKTEWNDAEEYHRLWSGVEPA